MYTSHGRDETVALPSLCGHAPESPVQPSPQSNARLVFSERCLTGEVYPTPDVERLANERALRKNSRCELLGFREVAKEKSNA